MGKKKRIKIIIALIILIIIALIVTNQFNESTNMVANVSNSSITLADVRVDESAIAKLIFQRRSHRNYSQKTLNMAIISEILWSTIGITVDGVSGATRAAPSAGATNPLKIYLSVHNVEDLPKGIYNYLPEEHKLIKKVAGDNSQKLSQAALGQSAIEEAQAAIIIVADYQQTKRVYGKRGERYVHIEAGHAAQNANLLAESYGVGAVMIGAFNDSEVKRVLGDINYEPLLIITLGWK